MLGFVGRPIDGGGEVEAGGGGGGVCGGEVLGRWRGLRRAPCGRCFQVGETA